MLTSLFKHQYVLRQMMADTMVMGYSAPGGHKDQIIALDVQPLSSDDLQALPEGLRTVKRVKTLGGMAFTVADEENDVQGDRLFYEGKWYECTSCHKWDHTLLSHYEAEFVEMPPGESPPDVEVPR